MNNDCKTLYNKAMEQVGLHVAVTVACYDGMFEGPKGPIIRGMRGTTIETCAEPGFYGSVKIKFEDQEKVKQLGWESDEQWLLSGALSLVPATE